MRHAGFGVSQSRTPPGRSFRWASRTSAMSASGGRCSITWAQKMPPSAPSGSAASVARASACSAARPASRQCATIAGVEVDASRLDPGLPAQLEELAAAAPDVQHGRGLGEEIEVGALAVQDVLARPAMAVLEAHVRGSGQRAQPGGTAGAGGELRRRRRGRASARPRRGEPRRRAAEHAEPIRQLALACVAAPRARRPGARGGSATGPRPLGQRAESLPTVADREDEGC